MEDAPSDEIADAVLKQFYDLPKKGKPLVRGGGVKEWVPLSGIVAEGRDSLKCLALATGMKCLPQNKIAQAQGIVLHDWHAEVLAIRSFNRFLLEECHALASSKSISSEYIRLRGEDERTASHFQPFELNDGIDLHMYCSEAPCGDASMELTIASQEDSRPWDLPPATTTPPETSTIPTSTTANPSAHLPGRSYFSELGIVRRKPSRPDAPPTLSKSCSDKIALKQCTSLLSSVTSLLISPANCYIKTLVLPESQYSSTACIRAFSNQGRMKELSGKEWGDGYAFKPFEVRTTRREFEYSRRQALATVEKLVPSNISASWIAGRGEISGELETLIGGVLQGRKQFNVRGASRVCKKRSWKLALEIAALVAVPGVQKCISSSTYGNMKKSECLEGRISVKEEARELGLKGWVRNSGGDGFSLDSGEI